MGKGSQYQLKYTLKLQYSGTNYEGWQIQKTGRTVQAEIEKALRIYLKRDIRIASSGRTDTGVHALEQYASFEFCEELNLQRLCIALNGILDRDVSVKNAHQMKDDFHARYSAVAREYKYKIYNSQLRSPFMNYSSMWVNNKLDVSRMNELLSALKGEHDFASFCKKKSANENTNRTIYEIKATKKDEWIHINIIGNAFLHNMIRIMIGTVVEIVTKDGSKNEIELILEKKDREYAGKTAPPYGLYLASVFYGEDVEVIKSAFGDDIKRLNYRRY